MYKIPMNYTWKRNFLERKIKTHKCYKAKKPSLKKGKLFIGLTTKPATSYKVVAKQHN